MKGLKMLNDDTILDDSVLIELGFDYAGKNEMDRDVFKIEPRQDGTMDYPFELQIVLCPQYPEINPNSGILSIYSPECEAHGIPPDLCKKENWTEEDTERANNYTIKIESMTQPIAWHVTRVGRLKSICHALAGFEFLK